MRHLIGVVILLGVLGGSAYAFGVRVHPEAIFEGLQKSEEQKMSPQKAVKLKLASGESLVGHVIKETSEGVVFAFDGAEVEFSNSEIISQTEVKTHHKPAAGGLKQPWQSAITYDPGLSLIPGVMPAKKNPAVKNSAGSPASTLWAVRSKTAAGVPSNETPNKPENKLYGVIPKDFFSAGSAQKWGDQLKSEMASTPRNPFIEARNAAEAAKSKANDYQAKSEAKLRELEEQGY